MTGSRMWRTLLAAASAGVFAASTAGTSGAAGPPDCVADCSAAFAVPGSAQPFGVTSGPLGSVWFSLNDRVGRIDQQGDITTYFVGSNAGTGWMTTDPSDGSVWFAERLTGRVGRIRPNGAITEFSLPTPTSGPHGIVFAADGNVYVTEQFANSIARLNPTTGLVTEIPIPTPNSGPLGEALGSDGAIWFIERVASKVGRMTLDGKFTEYLLTPGSIPNRIVAGPDGALWFTELHAGKVSRITTAGQLTEYPVAGGPVGIAVGKDGQLYVNLYLGHAVARVNLEGQVTGQWNLPGATGTLLLATGFGLDIWVTDTFGNKIYRVTPYALGG